MNINVLKAPLSKEIYKEYSHLIEMITFVPASSLVLKEIEGTGGMVSISDLIAYQIGWGKRLIDWYETGKKGKMPIMPGEGFATWNYVAIAHHFYQKYQYDNHQRQKEIFKEVVNQILDIVEKEYQTGYLDQMGIWQWCTLASGKQWSLSKWIKVNTSSPYKRASKLVKKWIKSKSP